MNDQDMLRINQKMEALRDRVFDRAKKDVADGYDPDSVVVCKECGSMVPCGPFDQILVGAWALYLSMEDSVGCPEENLDEVLEMVDRLCDIYEGYEEKEN